MTRFLSLLALACALLLDPGSADAASRFWVGGTGTWDGSTTTHWAATSGGAGGQSVPGSADTVTFDANSGGGTVTVNTTVNIQSITCGAFTGTLDFSVNNNDVTLSNAGGFNGSGSGARTIKLGNGTWTFTSTAGAGGNRWNMATTTNLTFDAGSSHLVFTGPDATGGTALFNGGGLTYNHVEFSANATPGQFQIGGSNTFATMTINAPNNILFVNGNTQTVTNFNAAGSSSAQISLSSVSRTASATISKASGSVTVDWAALTRMTFSGGATFTATNSFDFGSNSGITITAPSGGGGLLTPGGLHGGFQ